MGLFSKRAARREGPDEALTFLTASQANQIRSLVRTAFAEQGVEVTMHADRAVDDSGRTFGLWNVAAACHGAGGREASWPTLVHEHVRRVLTDMDAPDPFDALTPEEAAARTYIRLYDEGMMDSWDAYPHRELAPGIIELLALDLPESALIYNRRQAERLGGYAALREAALRNVDAVPTGAPERIDCGRDGYYYVLEDASVYTAGKALLLADLAGRLTPEAPGDLGWLLSVPGRHLLAWHCVHDTRVLGAVEGLVRVAQLFHQSTGPVSPHVFWTDGTTYHQLTRYEEGGKVSIEVGPEFQAVIEEAARRGGSAPR